MFGWNFTACGGLNDLNSIFFGEFHMEFTLFKKKNTPKDFPGAYSMYSCTCFCSCNIRIIGGKMTQYKTTPKLCNEIPVGQKI